MPASGRGLDPKHSTSTALGDVKAEDLQAWLRALASFLVYPQRDLAAVENLVTDMFSSPNIARAFNFIKKAMEWSQTNTIAIREQIPDVNSPQVLQ